MKREFLNLGGQPIANNFVKSLPVDDEFFFNLRVGFDEDSKLVSLMEFVDKRVLFNDHYVYHSSSSNTMLNHFAETARHIADSFRPAKVLEIGSNDGIFLKHFDRNSAFGVEPCGNFASMTNSMGYRTYPLFWNMQTVETLVDEIGKVDVVFAANCMCHVPEIMDAFASSYAILNDGGLFIFEDPSLMPVLTTGSYDQFYDEHAHIFSATAVVNLLERCGFSVERIVPLDVHGGSNRYYARKTGPGARPDGVQAILDTERDFGMQTFELFSEFGAKVEQSGADLRRILGEAKSHGGRLIGYGATSKSTVVYNYCGIGPELLDYIVDTTPSKQGTFSPGTHIPVVAYGGLPDDVTHAFLGAWNFEREIIQKEKGFVERGGKFITHVPRPRIVE